MISNPLLSELKRQKWGWVFSAHSMCMAAMPKLILPKPRPDRRRVPPDLEKAVRNGGHIPWARFAAQGADAERPFGLRLGGTLLGVAQRRGDEIKVRTWLAE